jgi:hypothetical protein
MKKYDWGCIKLGEDNKYFVMNKDNEAVGSIWYDFTLTSYVLEDCVPLTAKELRDIAAFMEAL